MVALRDRVPGDPALAAIRRPLTDVEVVEDGPVPNLVHGLLGRLAIVGMEKILEPRADERFRRPAQHLGPGRIDRAVDPVEAADHEEVAARTPDQVALRGPLERRRPQQGLGLAPVGDVVEQDGHAPLHRFPDAQGMYVEPAPQGHRPALEPDGLAGQGDLAVGVEPARLDAGNDLADPAALDIAEAGLSLEGGIHLDEAVVDGAARGVEPHLDDAEPGIDGVEQRPVSGLAFGELALLGAKAGDVELAAEEVA